MRTLFFVVVLFAAPGARADDVEPPPIGCPAGTIGRASHAGPHCQVVACELPCPGGLSCVDHGYCIERIPCGGHRGMREPECTVEAVVSECTAGACARGTCELRSVCLPGEAPVAPTSAPAPTPATPMPAPSTVAAPSDPPSSGCHASPRAAHGALSGLLVLLVASLRARR